MFTHFIQSLIRELQLTLPGEAAQYKMAPQGRIQFPKKEVTTDAAVLIVLYPTEGEPHTVYMKRPQYLGVHSGQVSFPGGKYETSDTNLQQTAIRETTEELGIEANALHIIGALTSLNIPVSGFNVYPYIAYCTSEPAWKPDPKEVEHLIKVGIHDLLDDKNIRREIWNIRGKDLEVPFYHIENEKIWGATAMITSELLAIIRRFR